MQYLIRMVCDECSDFRRDILIDEDATFLELNDIILKSCAYPDNQMTSFYVCDEEWQRGEQITREDMRDNVADDFLYTMADTRLSEFLDGGVRHLEYALCWNGGKQSVVQTALAVLSVGSGVCSFIQQFWRAFIKCQLLGI